MKRTILKNSKGPPFVSIEYDNTCLDKVRMAARERYAWPGGYEICAITNDGGLLCSKCIRENYRQVVHDTKHEWNTGWRVVGAIAECELEDRECSHCSAPLGYQSE